MMFGPHTQRFSDLKKMRILVKHGKMDEARTMMDGILEPVLEDPDINEKALAKGLKIPINSVYGMTSAHFPNRFNDVDSGTGDRNLDNKVAKRGALFMVTLKHEVQKRGYPVVHIKTDSIKVADCDHEIAKFIMDFGVKYGYNFELEEVYDKLAIVNKSTYIAHSVTGEHAVSHGGWTATGLQFQVPYVFKTLFTGESISVREMAETKSATTNLYLDFNESLPEGEHKYDFVGHVGSFVPILPGHGGGELMRQQKDGSFSYATGSKGWRWKETTLVLDNHLEDKIDYGYYQKLDNDAVKAINKLDSVNIDLGETKNYDYLTNHQRYISTNPKSNDWVKLMIATNRAQV